jgi:hypothetical protein
MWVVAICDGPPADERVGAGLLAILVVAVYVTVVALIVRRSRAKRPLVALLIATIVLGGLIVVIPHGFSDSTDYPLRFLLGVLAGTAAGGVLAAVRRSPEIVRHLAVGALGGATALPAFVAWIVMALALTGSCFD